MPSSRLWITSNAIIALFIIVSSMAIPTITAVPAKFDAVETPTTLLEPPQFAEVEIVAADGRFGSKIDGVGVQQQLRQVRQQDITAIDSYGNPIEFLKPVDTPDGRKVVSAQGVQFEIPNYASGITDIRNPANELLPPNIGEFDIHQQQQPQHHQEINALLNNNNNHNDNNNGDDININNRNNNNDTEADNQFEAAVSYNDYNDATDRLDIKADISDENNDNKLTTVNIYHNDQNAQETSTLPQTGIHTIHMQTLTTSSIEKATIQPKLSHFIHTLDFDTNSKNSIPSKRSQLTNPVTTEAPSTLSASSTYAVPTISVHAAPLSNGNFNYPNVPTDISIINRIAAKYRNPLPTLEPIVVAEPNNNEDLQLNNNNVQQESIKVEVNYNQIPAYLLELNDTDIGGPVDYIPTDEQPSHRFISWDLLPPEEKVDNSLIPANIKQMAEPDISAQNSDATNYRVSLANNPSFINNRADNEPATPVTVRTTTTTQRYNRGNIHFSNSTPAPPKTTRRTTPRRTTTASTTRRYTTTTTTTTTTTPKPDLLTTTEAADTEYYRLEKGDSYTLPPWLAGLDYADLDVAVTFIVPTDNNEYNHTIDRDISPPLEPYEDLKNINLPAPENEVTTTSRPSTTRTITTTPRTTTTSRPTTRTTTTTTAPTYRTTPARSYWIQTNTVANTKPPSFNNNRFTSNQISQTSTTRKPNYNFHTSFNNLQNNGQYTPRTTTSTAAPFGAETKGVAQKFNPFLSGQNYAPVTTSKSTSTFATTTTTTTTTPKTEIIAEVNPFEPTIPTWLEGFDYPELGAAVPFNYDPVALERNVDFNLQAPLRFAENKPNFPTDTQSPFPSNLTPLQQNAASSASTISTNQVNAPSSIKTDVTANTFSSKNELDSNASTVDNQQTHIPAPFEDDNTLNNANAVKTTFSKGQGGKVISSTLNTQAPLGQRNPFLPSQPIGSSSNSVPAFAARERLPATTTRSVFSPTVNYGNRFGGPPGILRPYDNVRG